MVSGKLTAPTSLFLIILILLGAVAVALTGIDADSLWYDEAWSVYAIDAPPPATHEPPRGLRARVTTPIRAALADVQTTLAVVADDVHPPLYFLMLDIWTFLTGESELALRYLSLLWGLVGVAVTARLGRALFGASAGVYAALLFGTSLLWGYYAREARMYSALMTLAGASTLAYVRLWRRGGIWRGGGYAVLVALGFYTHYTAVLVPVAHGLHLLFTRPRALLRWLGACVLALILTAAWLPSLYAQIVTNPTGPLTAPEPTNWTTVATLTGYFTGRLGGVYVLLLMLAVYGAWQARRRAVLLLGLWLVVVPGAVLAANALLLPIYNPRYTLAALPALALLGGYGLSLLGQVRYGGIIALLVAGLLAVDGVTAYNGGWGQKPRYREAINGVMAARAPTSPLLVRLVGYDPATYYTGRVGLTDWLTVNIAHTDPDAAAVATLVSRFESVSDVWLMMPTNHPSTWHTVAGLLRQGRVITYRDGVENMLMYRFSLPADVARLELPLSLVYGTTSDNPTATFTGTLAETITARIGEPICVAPPLTMHGDAAYSLVLARGYNGVVDQFDGQTMTTPACVTLPPDANGDYALYWVVYDPQTQTPYPVWDGGVWWGNWIVGARVVVD